MHVSADTLLSLLELDLFASGWNGALEPYPAMPDRQFAMSCLYKSICKKYLPGTSATSSQADSAALELFTKVNDSCRDWQLDTSKCSDLEVTALGEIKSLIDRFFYPDPDVTKEEPIYRDFILSQNSIISGFGLGNGANIGARETDFYSKLATSDLSSTSRALHEMYVDAIRCSPTWYGMELSRAKKMGYAIASSSRLSFVPKTAKISRTICTEPVLNTLFQKGMGYVLEHRLREVFGIDLTQQPVKNAELARLGSLNGKFGTIDLSSASDSISLTLCKEILPRRAFDVLCSARSPSAVLPDGKVLELHMISSMGNAFTFPLQTLIFSSIVHACYKVYGIPIVNPRRTALGNFAVFGDDIIVYERAYELVCRMLSLLGFSVNVEKSFNTGLFRESCGHDYYSGYNVRGVYIKHLRDANDCYSAINRLVRWSARHDVGLYNLVSFLRRKVRFLPIPYDEGDDMGIKVPYDMLVNPKFDQKNKTLRATVYRISKLSDRVHELCHPTKLPSLTGWFENPDGLMIALLAGSIRQGCIVVRSTRRHAQLRKRYSSSWDYIPFLRAERLDYAACWKSAAWKSGLVSQPFHF